MVQGTSTLPIVKKTMGMFEKEIKERIELSKIIRGKGSISLASFIFLFINI